LKTQYFTASSLDGFIADANHGLEWLFALGDVQDTSYPTFIRDVGALAMGSSTYEWMLRHAVGPEAESPQPWPYEQPTWVFTSRSLPAVDGADVRFVKGDVRPVHREMVEVAAGRNVWVVGGGDLAGQFHDHGLLDEIHVQIGSVTLGSGKPLFPRRITVPPLRLVSARAIGTGFVELVYEVVAVPPLDPAAGSV
jgi:dihydrofolate reductase